MTDTRAPKLSTFIYDLPEEIVIKTDYAQTTGDVDLSELFKAKRIEDSYVFEHENSVRKWLAFVNGELGFTSSIKLPFHDKVLAKKLNHILWVLPSMESCNALYALLETAKEAKQIKDSYSVINCYDPSYSSPEMIVSALDSIVKSDPGESRSLTLTSGLLVKEVLIPYWSGIFILRNFGSSSYGDFSQIVERASMPWLDVKKESFVFSFSYRKTLLFANYKLRKEYRNRFFSDDVDSFKKFIRQNLKVSPIEFWSLSGEKAIDEDDVYEVNPHESRSLWTSRRLIDVSALAKFIKDKQHKKTLKVSGKTESERLERAIEAVQNINARIPAFLYLMERKDKSLIVYLRESLEHSSGAKIKKGGSRKRVSLQEKAGFELLDFEAITRITPNFFLELTDSGVLKEDAIDRLACDFRASEIVPFVSSQHERARTIIPHDVGFVFNSMPWPDFKYQFKDVDAWDKLLDDICSPEKENEDSIRTITMLLCYLQLLKPVLESSPDSATAFEIDADLLQSQFLRIVSVKEDSDDIMSEFSQKDQYDLWAFPNPSVFDLNEKYKKKLADLDYLERLIVDVRQRSEKMIEHYNSSHSYNRYQKAYEPYYSDDKTILVNVPQGEEELIISDDTIVIGRNAFLNCSRLKRVFFPKSIQIIEEGAFHGCNQLEKIEFAESGGNDWQTIFDKQIKKVAINTFSGSGLPTDFCEKQYKTKPFFYQSSERPNSIKVWCVDENGFYTESTGVSRRIPQEEGVSLPCIHSNFKDNENTLKAEVKSFLQRVRSDSEVFYDVAPIYLVGAEKEVDERKRQIAYLFCQKKAINATLIGNLRFDEEFDKLIGKVMDEMVSKSSVGGTIYLSFDINSAELNNQEFADFLKDYYSERNNVKADLVNFCKKHNIGMTFYPNTGVFLDEEEKDPDNRMKVEENSYTIKIIYVSSSKLDSIAEELCKTYYQQSVLVEDEINNRAYFKKHPLVQPNMETLEQDNIVLYKAFESYRSRKERELQEG